MKTHDATLISGIVFTIVGAILWINTEVNDKWFSLGSNLVTTGIAVIAVSLLVKIKK